MKKIIALLLVLLMMLSMAACGGQEGTEENGMSQEGSETTAPVAEKPEQTEPVTEPPQTEAPTEPEAPAFDTAWAGAEFEMPIPEPPFEAAVSYSESQKMYLVQNGDASGEISYDSMAQYCDTLKTAGYANVEKDAPSADDFQAELDQTGGAATAFTAENESGYRVVVYKEFSTWMIMVYCPA